MSGGAQQHQFADWLLAWTHRVPHFDFRFRRLHAESHPFDVDPNGEYAQSLVVLCAFALLLALLFLLAVVIVWVTQCCIAHRSSGGPNRAASRRHIGRLSCALFLCSVFCFALMGVCLFGNEHLNKSVSGAANGLSHLSDAFRRASARAQQLNQTQWTMSRHIDELTVLIERKSKDATNQTAQIREVDALLTALSDKVDEMKQRLGRTMAILADAHFLESARRKGERVEFERWLLCLLLALIMCAVLFAGVVAFCRQSRKGAVIFSGLGLVIFLVAWLLFSAAFPLTVAFADFCADGRPFLRARVNDELIDVLHFYTECDEGAQATPGALPLGLIGELADEESGVQHKLEMQLTRIFDGSADLQALTEQVAVQCVQSARTFGALQTTLQCGALHTDAAAMRDGFCRRGFVGSALIAVALLLLGLALFVLLILVSKSWYIFTRLPSDYLEVGEEDQFSPRCHDAMPDNIYDTNIFNPRARQHLASTSAAEGGDRMPNGGTPNGTNLQMDTLEAPPSWQRQMLAHNAAHATAPPAGGTLRLGTLTRNGGSGVRGGPSSGNYQQLNGGTSGAAAVNPYGRFQEFGDA